MNMNQLTQKTREAIQRAQGLAVEYQHMQVDQEHLAAALMEDGAGLIPQLLNQAGANADMIRQEVLAALGRIPRVSGPGREPDRVYITADLDRALQEIDIE